jgi:hypothetical protein
MAFGKSFKTLKEARAHLKLEKQKNWAWESSSIEIRKFSKKLHPRKKNRYHVGTYLDWLNF